MPDQKLTEYLNIRLDPNLKKQLLRYSIMEKTTLGNIARRALKKFIDEQIILDMQNSDIGKD